MSWRDHTIAITGRQAASPLDFARLRRALRVAHRTLQRHNEYSAMCRCWQLGNVVEDGDDCG
ncbi:hypothetical protein ASF73_00605 [Xanthomonas sp. Leaf131]|nr:hypothetical protein ASF73_00605 [Xanthomonas sp. Leaf131]